MKSESEVVSSETLDPGIVVSLALGDDTVSTEHPVELTVRIENTTHKRIRWGYGSSTCRLSCLVWVGDEYRLAFIPRVCTMDARPYDLDPGEFDTQTFMWGGYVGSTEQILLPPGTYAIVGLAGRYRSDPRTIVVR